MRFTPSLLLLLFALCFAAPLTAQTTTTPATTTFPGTKSQWNGGERYDFLFNDRKVICVVPQQAAPGKPWIWRPAFFGAFASVDSALLQLGYHVVYYDLTHLYGSPRSVRLGNEFYQHITQTYGLSPKVTLEGFSRGGLFAFQWAAQNPDKTACIYVDAPVCDLRSWPGKKRPELWNDALKEWQVEERDITDAFAGHALNTLPRLAQAHIPIISVCGAADKTVPFDENMKKVRDRYQALGGVVEILVKPDCDHHPHSLQQPEPVVDFINRYQQGESEKNQLYRRGNLDNAFYKFTHDKKGCVAFLGGSITEMKGWRDMIKEDLQQRFPYTAFTFIDAGISSLGSTPHAFRLEHDVLEKGTPDLLFVEAAVNDATNHFTPIEQVRGMEGIVRHLLHANPMMDIVMMHFAFDPFIAPQQQGAQPDVILNHERVANHYLLSSINLAQEISSRIGNGELTWKEFGGVHPAWRGHQYYCAAIDHLLDSYTKPIESYQYQPHPLPTPLDSCSYENGAFLNITQASHLKGFQVMDSWTPDQQQSETRSGFIDTPAAKKIQTRPGFVEVPMLVATTAGASFTLSFTGKAIGIFCVSGPQAAVLEYSIDGSPYQKLDTYTEWSHYLYIPWVFMLASDLNEGEHLLKLRVAKGERTECQIRNFVVNR